MASSDRPEAGVYDRGDRSESMEESCQRRGFALRTVLLRSRGSRSEKNHREVFNVPGTRETVDWGYSSDSVQWTVSLGCAAREGSPGRIRSRSARDLDPLLLAGSRTRIRRREYHGSCSRN